MDLKKDTQKSNAFLLSENIPSAIEFGFCPVNRTSSKKIVITNHNYEETSFSFESTVFQVSPQSGKIPSRSKATFTISFTPKEAVVVIATVILNVEGEEPKIIKVSAIGKYPFITINQTKLKFEPLLVGKSTTKEILKFVRNGK